MDLVELHLPRAVAFVGLARLIVTAGARQAGLAEERLGDLKIAVSEAVTHSVTSTGSGEPLVLAFGVRDAAFEVHVSAAEPAGATVLGEGALRRRPSEGGLGLTLMEGLADEVVFPESSRSQMVLRFRLAPDA